MNLVIAGLGSLLCAADLHATSVAVASARRQIAFSANASYLDTWWFYALLGLSLIVIVTVLWRIHAASKARAERLLQRQVDQRTLELARLAELTQAINEAMTIEDVLEHLYENLRTMVPYDRIGLALLDENQIVLRAVWSRGKAEPVGISRGYEAPLKGSSLEATLESGKPRIIPDLERYLEEHPESESTRRILSEGIRSSLTCPLRALGRPVGFVFFSSFESGTYNGSHSDFLQKIAGHLSLIVEKSKLYEDLLETKRRLEMANQELARLAAVDGLTGLANRRTFDERLEAEWRRVQRSEEPISLLMIDVDYFKAFNDENGHLEGDDCLRTIADCLTKHVRRAGDLVARYGGEEFSVILPQCDVADGASIAENLRAEVENRGIRHGSSAVGPNVTISIGLAGMVPDVGESLHDFVELADRTLYEAKRAGRNRVVVAELSSSDEEIAS